MILFPELPLCRAMCLYRKPMELIVRRIIPKCEIPASKITYGHLMPAERNSRMSSTGPTMKETRAFKIGARARKFALEGCVIEGYEILYTALAESKTADPELHALL